MATRRKFIQTAGLISMGSIALPTILTSCVKWKGANDRLQIAHIGVGSRGTDELSYYFLPRNDFRVIGVADAFRSRMENAANLIKKKYEQDGTRNPQVALCKDYRELLDRKDLDVVAVTTTDHWHLPVAIDAARAGKHVHVNKPLGLSLEYMLILERELQKNGLKFNYGTQQRSYAFMKKAMEYIHQGALGDIQEVLVWAPGGGLDRHIGYFKPMEIPSDLDYQRWLGPAPDAPYTADRVHRDGSFFINDYSIGFLGGWGAHPLDVLVWGLKEQLTGNYSVQASGRADWPEGSMYNNINVWDAQIEYANGLKLRFMSQDLAKPVVMEWTKEYRQNGTLFKGTKGWMSLSRTYAECSIPEIHQKINDFPKKEYGLDGERGLHGVEFAQLIRGESERYMDIRDAITSDLISHHTNIAIRLNQSLNWDAAGMRIENSEPGNLLLNRNHRDYHSL